MGTGRYLDVKIDIEKIILNRLIISVVEAPPIKDIIFSGNDKISDKKLIDELSLSSNNFVNYNDIQESVNSLISYYKEKNYHNVNVSYSIDDLFIEGKDLVILFLLFKKEIKLSLRISV